MIRAFFFFFGATFSCVMAQEPVSLETYAAMVGNVNQETHRIKTLNDNGMTMCYTTELTEAFLEQCRDINCTHVLEVGCAYGVKSSQIVQTGVFLVANDLDSRHLEIMEKTFTQLSETHPQFKNVRYAPGNFATLNESQLGSQKYDAILCESVLHFMLPEDLRKTLINFNKYLNNGGKVYITNISPYQIYRETFQVNKANGSEWPGVFTDPEGISPVVYNVIDEEILLRELKRAGFKVLMSKYIQKPFLEQEFQHDNRDWIIAVAEKE